MMLTLQPLLGLDLLIPLVALLASFALRGRIHSRTCIPLGSGLPSYNVRVRMVNYISENTRMFTHIILLLGEVGFRIYHVMVSW